MHKKCDACEFLKRPTNQIFITNHWSIGIGADQPYLGRAFVTLKTHKGSLSELSTEEWQEFKDIVGKLELAYSKAFGADMLNLECNMNHAFRTEPFNPHVHWHIYPRYKTAVQIAGITFKDPLFGSHIDEDLVRIVGEDVVKDIASRLRDNLK